MKAICDYGKLDRYKRADTLFFEFHGTQASVREQTELVEAIAADFGGEEFQWAAGTEERNKLWEARHNALYAFLAQCKPGEQAMGTDVCVPISRLAECIAETRADMVASGFESGFIGHVGDGNFHLAPCFDPEDREEMAELEWICDRLVKRALAMGGTCTGEHGIGYGKLDFLQAEHGEAVSVMRLLKQALDPDNIMNPGKIVEP